MSIPHTTRRRNTLLAAALALVGWGLFGAADLPNLPDGGLRYDASGVVGRVEEGGGADRAGVRVGDRILSIDGVPLSETEVLSRQPRAAIGETRLFVAERTDDASGVTTREQLAITYGSDLAAHPIGLIGGALLGLVFLLCGVTAYLRAPSTQALLFGIVGICLAAVLLPGPYLAAPGPRSFVSALALLAAFAVFACLLHLALIFPEPRSVLRRRGVVTALYLPALLIGAASAMQIARGAQPGPVLNLLGTLGLIAYMLLTIVALIHRYATTNRESRAAYGLGLLAWGIVIGFGPLTVSAGVGLLAPSVSLPGSDYYFLSLVLIPLAFTVALLRRSAHGRTIAADRAAGV
jgi:hypothetical protein